ncbi:MAG: aspartate kinase [Alphaproteobacteria bacterium]|nr:aspartate kinase [Alphaproteobacteria bacterium]
MARLVLKFGGTSVADPERIRRVARHVKREADAGHQVAVVVSAMAGETNRLVALAEATALEHEGLMDAREYDAIVATGESVAAGLLALTLQDMGLPARSWQGWQIPIRTSEVHGAARILDIATAELEARLAQGQIPVVTGFQGLGPDQRVTTLGRGGSDTSAVAVAAALRADRCDIYTDVDGVYTTDPRIVRAARKLERVAYEEMLEMASLGAKVLQTRSVELAMAHRVKLQVLSSFAEPDAENPGTLVCDEDEIVEHQAVSGIAYSRNEAKVTLVRVKDKPGVAGRIFSLLADSHINVDMIVQAVSADGVSTDMTFTVARENLAKARDTLNAVRGVIGYESLVADPGVAKLSVIGIGMRSHEGVAAAMFRTLGEKGINIQAISTSEIKISVLIADEYTELAVRALHTTYGLDADS